MVNTKDILEEVPHSRGLYKLYDNDKLLFVGISSDLKKRIKYFLKLSEMDNLSKKLKWVKQINNFKFQLSSSLWELLLIKKDIIESELPQNQNQYRIYDDYVYLAINFYNAPFFKITDDTQQDYFYIGPFRDRFFLIDILSIFESQFGAPICEKEIAKCSKYKDGICKGFCVLDKDLFKNFVLENILSEPIQKIKEIKKRFNKLEENLDFEKSEELRVIIKKLEKFYNLTEALILSKQLKYNWIEKEYNFEVERGMLLRFSSNNNIINEVQPKNIVYRQNEIIAYEKSDLDEILIIFDHLKKLFPKEINKLYREAKKNIFNKIMEEEKDE